MSEMKFIENVIVISTVLKYIKSMIDEYQSLDVEKNRELRKLIIDVMVEVNTKDVLKQNFIFKG